MMVLLLQEPLKFTKKVMEQRPLKFTKKLMEKNLIRDRLVPNKEAHKSLIDITKSNIRQVVL